MATEWKLTFECKCLKIQFEMAENLYSVFVTPYKQTKPTLWCSPIYIWRFTRRSEPEMNGVQCKMNNLMWHFTQQFTVKWLPHEYRVRNCTMTHHLISSFVKRMNERFGIRDFGRVDAQKARSKSRYWFNQRSEQSKWKMMAIFYFNSAERRTYALYACMGNKAWIFRNIHEISLRK